MYRRSRVIIVLLLLVAISLACSIGGGGISSDEAVRQPGSPATKVVPPDTTVSATAVPTDAPEPTDIPPPTDAPEPVEETVVAYVGDDGNIYLYSSGRLSVDPITSSGGALSVRLSHDGAYVAYLREAASFGTELWLAPTDGSGERVLVTPANLASLDPDAFAVTPYEFDWVPGEQKILFNTRQVFEFGPGLILYDDLHVFDLESSTAAVLLPVGSGGGRFAVSPDGEKVAFTRAESVGLVNADGTGILQDIITFPYVITYSEYYFYPTPTWKADSSSFSVVIPPEDPLAVSVGSTAIFQIANNGSINASTAIDDVEFFGGGVEISGDMTTAAVYRRAGDPLDNLQELVLTTLDGASSRFVVVGDIGGLDFAWSPEDARLLFTNSDAGLFLLEVDDLAGDIAGISPGERFVNLEWISGEKYISWQLFGGVWRLILGDVDGSLRTLSDGMALPNDVDGGIIYSIP